MRTAHHIASYGPFVSPPDRTTGTTPGVSATELTSIPRYEVRVRGHLGSQWTAWFDGLRLTTEDDGITVIRGPVVDQAALHGLLQKLRDVGIPLISLTQLPPDATPDEGSTPQDEGQTP